MLMMLPPRPRAIMRDATARVPCRTVFKLARTRASQPFSPVSRKAARNVPPTLLTSTSMPPKRSMVAATARSTASPSRTSAGSARACPPAPSISAAVACAVAAGLERRPVGLADRDARLRAPVLDAPHAPGGGRRADVDHLAVVVEPDLRRLPELARLPLAADVDVLGLVQRVIDLGREPGACAGDQREHQGEGGDAAHGDLLDGQAADLTAGRAGDASGRAEANHWPGAERGL